MEILTKEKMKQILYGATFLGGGGGGPLETAVEILEKLAEKMDVSVTMIDLDDPEIQAGDYGAMVACLGSPEAMKSGTFGPDGYASFEAFKEAVAAEDPPKNVKYLYSGEMGGFNTFAPMLVAIYSDADPAKRVKLLNADANGRAVPELNTSLNAARGFAPDPVGMGTMNVSVPGGPCNKVIAHTSKDSEAERIARGICGVFDNQIGFSTWAMSRADLEGNGVVGCVGKAMAIGEALEKAAAEGANVMKYLGGVLECRSLGSGTIIKKETKIIAGFDCGTTTIRIDGEGAPTYTIDFQNENLIMRDDSGKAIITAPEIITMVCLDQDNYAHPLNNASTAEGMRIELILVPSDDKWWDKALTPPPNECWLDCLKRVGYTGPQIRYSGEANS